MQGREMSPFELVLCLIQIILHGLWEYIVWKISHIILECFTWKIFHEKSEYFHETSAMEYFAY